VELVFEIVNRAGRSLERHRATGERLSLGRAFDNDLILSDETVSPHHAAIEKNAAGETVIIDLNSLNGVRSGRVAARETSHLLSSGNEYSFGRLRVRIYDLDHTVEPAVLIGGTDGIVNALGSTSVLSIILATAFLVAIGEQWLNTFSTIVWQELAIGVIGVITVGLLIAAFWAVVGRVVKHEGRFQTQLALVMSYLLIQSGVVSGYEILQFNTLNKVLSVSVFLCVSVLVLTAFVWLALHVATHLASEARLRFALIVASVLLGVSLYPEVLKQTDFSATPEYIQKVKPPTMRFARGGAKEAFMTRVEQLFDQPNHRDD